MSTPLTPNGAGLVFRQPGRWFLGGVYLFVVALWVLDLTSSPGGDDGQGWGLGTKTAVAALFVLATAMVLLVRVRASPRGLDVRDQIGRRRHLSWPEVHHVEMRGYWRGLQVVTVDGRWVKLLTYGVWERRAAGYLAQLEAYRWAQQQALGLV